MNWLKNLKIRTKLLYSFLIVTVLAGVLGYIGISNLKTISKADKYLYSDVVVALGYCNDMTRQMERIRVNVREAVLAKDNTYLETCFTNIETLGNSIDTILKLYEPTIVDVQDRKNFNRVVEVKKEYFSYLPKFRKTIDFTNNSASVAMLRGEWLKTAKEFEECIVDFAEYNKVLGKRISDSNTKLSADSVDYLLIIICLIIVISSILGFVISSNIQKIIQSVVKQTRMLVDAAIAGKLATRAKPEDTNREFREIIVGINNTLDAVIGPLNVAAEYVDRISKGNIPEKITDNYNGDFNEIKNNLNVCIDSVNALVSDSIMLAQAGMEGKLAIRAEASKHQGDFAKIIDGINKTLDSVIGPLNIAAEYVDRISKGNIPEKITDHYNGDFNNIKNNLNICIDTVNALVADTAMLSVAAVDGKLDARADVSRHQGDFRKILEGVNSTLDAVIGPLNVAAEYVDRIAKGDMPEFITDNYKGDFNNIKNNLNSLIKSFAEIITKAKMVAQGDLTVTLAKRSENDELMAALSDMVSRLSEIVGQVMEAAQNVATSSSEMSNSAVMISQGANEQSASAEQVSSSIEEMASSIQQNSDNSIATEKIAVASAQGMEDVNSSAQKCVDAMRQICQKIKIINDIAGKTDILAINAAIEAARAGEQGKGFAVVAAEVRKLAEVSQRAAIEINELSASTLRVTEQSGDLMTRIIPEIQKTAQLVKEIAASSHEQRSGSEQITKAVIQFTQVTQQNAASAEEMSSSSEELASQAELLKDTIGFFKTGKQLKTEPVQPVHKQTKRSIQTSVPLDKNKTGGFNLKLQASERDDHLFENF